MAIQPLSKYGPSGLPRALDKRRDKARELRDEIAIKRAIKEQAHWKCVVCGRRCTEGHEVRPKSLGGEVAPHNTIPVCAAPRGVCHQLLQHWIVLVENVEPIPGALWPDCTKPLRFIVPAKHQDLIFPHGNIPAHVFIVPEGV